MVRGRLEPDDRGMRGRILIIGLALAAVAIAFVASRGGDPERAARPPAAHLPPDARQI